MSLFRRLVSRGNAVIREWYSNEGVDESSRLMIAELGANTLVNLCGEDMKEWTSKEREDRVNAIRIALTSAFQVGRSHSVMNKCKNHRKM
jgi:hypothetical protein